MPRAKWASVAASLNGEFGETAYELFEEWSATAPNFRKTDARSTWKSCSRRNCSAGTLIHIAKGYGWTAPRRHPVTPSEQARIEREALDAQRAREARKQIAAATLEQSQTCAGKIAAAMWEACVSEPGTFPYLVTKRILPHGAKRGRDDANRPVLVVPMRDIDGVLWSLQTIRADGGKRYLSGSRTAGCFHAIGEQLATAKRIILTESFGNAGALAAHHEGAIVCAFSVGQLLNVGTALATRYPNAALIFAADFDSPEGGDGGPGVHYATKAANALGAELWIPEAIPGRDKTDFSDWHILQRQQSERRAA